MSNFGLFENLILVWLLACGLVILSFYNATVDSWTTHGKAKWIRAQSSSQFNRWVWIPKSYFWHFYAFGIVNQIALLGFQPLMQFFQYQSFFQNSLLTSILTLLRGLTHPATCATFLLTIQILRRLLEQCFLIQSTPASKMHIVSYLVGLGYYLAVPLTVYVAKQRHVPIVYTGMGLPRSILFGSLLFVAASILQFYTHWYLAQLRRQKQAKSVKSNSTYYLPEAGPFNWISCPHYFAEIMIYTALCIVLPDTTMVACLTFVILCMIKSAKNAHDSYHNLFGRRYPKHRKALVPFLW